MFDDNRAKELFGTQEDVVDNSVVQVDNNLLVWMSGLQSYYNFWGLHNSFAFLFLVVSASPTTSSPAAAIDQSLSASISPLSHFNSSTPTPSSSPLPLTLPTYPPPSLHHSSTQ